jgi:glycosyltransferase involved in cell wall biosynthesis
MFYSHGQHFNKLYYSQKFLFRLWIKFVFKIIDGIVVVGKTMSTEYYELIDPAKVFTVYNILVDEYPNFNRTFSTDRITVLYLSTLTEKKGIFDFLNAAAKLVNDKRFTFRICGDFLDIYPEEKRKIMNSINLSHNLTYIGRVENQRKINEFMQADIFVFPSHFDSFGLVNLEAMAAGLPIISTNQGAMSEIIKEENGVLFEIGDIDKLVLSIKKLGLNPKLRQFLSDSNLQKFKDEFTISNFHQNWSNVLTKFID